MRIIFETEHLRVRAFETQDADRLYKNHLDSEMEKWFPNECYEDLDETRGAIGFYADCVNKNKLPFVLAAELKETGELIGDTGISEVEGKPGEVEIGYVICRESRGRGYATELVKAMSDFAVSVFQTHTIYGRVIKGNAASVRVLEKSGYCFAKEEFGAADDPYGNGMLVYLKKA